MIALGNAPIGGITNAAQKALDVSKALHDGGWRDAVVSFEFNGTLVLARWDNDVEQVIARYNDLRRLGL